MKLKHYWMLSLLGLYMMASMQALAANDLPYNRVSFTVSSETEVENDRLVAVLFYEAKGKDTRALATQVNEAISWGMGVAKKQPKVESQTLTYSTNPFYNDGKVEGWRVRQSVQLKSDDSQALSELLGQLQEKLSIESVQYEVSSRLRKATEEKLIADALGKFKTRAEQILKNMGRQSYKLVNLNVSNSFSQRPPYPMVSARGGYAMAEAAPSPELTAGTQQIVINVNAEIELSEN